jgi:hypothetical protein
MTNLDRDSILQEAPLSNAPLDETPVLQPPTERILVWRKPIPLWIGINIMFGLALPGYIFYKMQDPIGLNLALPAACVATFLGLLTIARRAAPLKSHDEVFFVFLKYAGVVIAALSLLLWPVFLIGIVVGLIYGVPWAIWVSLITAYHCMIWGDHP